MCSPAAVASRDRELAQRRLDCQVRPDRREADRRRHGRLEPDRCSDHGAPTVGNGGAGRGKHKKGTYCATGAMPPRLEPQEVGNDLGAEQMRGRGAFLGAGDGEGANLRWPR